MGQDAPIRSIVFSPDGKMLASASNGRLEGMNVRNLEVRLWDPQTGALLRTLSPGASASILTVAFSPDGKMLACGSSRLVRLWDTQTGALKQTIDVVSQDILDPTIIVVHVNTVVFSPDSKMVATGSGMIGRVGNSARLVGGEVKLWDVQTGEMRQRLEGHGSEVKSVVFSPNGNTLASGGMKAEGDKIMSEVKLWDVGGLK
jgi:WD40 repeat protein